MLAILFSKRNKIGSKIIQKMTHSFNKTRYETPSHVALLINNRWVIESTLERGVHIISFEKWSKNNEIIHTKIIFEDFNFGEIKEELKRIQGKKYDWPGVLYFGLCILLNKLFKKPIPEFNKWHKYDRYFCTEILTSIYQEDYFDMKSPAHVLSDFVKEYRDK